MGIGGKALGWAESAGRDLGDPIKVFSICWSLCFNTSISDFCVSIVWVSACFGSTRDLGIFLIVELAGRSKPA